MIPAGPSPRTPAGLRVAVIGVGRMGMRHVQAAKNLGMTVCGVADASAATLDAARSQNAAESYFTDANELLRVARPEAVVVATTAPTHAPFTIAAAKVGARWVLCEKPMASSLAEADAMMRACRDAGAALAVNHQMRFMPQYADVKAMLGGDALGPLSSILVAGSNFGLAMNASHYFEVFRYITGGPARGVSAWFEAGQLTNPRGAQFDDRSGRLIAWSSAGTPMYLDFSVTSGYGMLVVYNCKLGQIVVDELQGFMRVVSRKPEHRELPTTRYGMPADVTTSAIEPVDAVTPTMAVWSAMLAGQPYPDGAAGTHALRCLVAAHASHAAGGREVRLDDAALPTTTFAWA